MSSHGRCGWIWNSPHLACVWCRKCRHIRKIYAILVVKSVLLQFTHFVAKCVLSQFTHFCVEKNLSKNFLCGEKMTNMRSANTWTEYQFHVTFVEKGLVQERHWVSIKERNMELRCDVMTGFCCGITNMTNVTKLRGTFQWHIFINFCVYFEF